MPPFARVGDQFTEEEVNKTYKTAPVRIHVERSIQRLKLCNILAGKITVELYPYAE